MKGDLLSMHTPHLLIVDDDPDIRELLHILLKKEGYRLTEAPDGRAAVEAVRAEPDIALILLDIMMPAMNGFDAARRIREISDAPILFLTARSSDADRTRAYERGGDDYIVKPFHATELCLKIRAMLKRYTLYRDRAETGSTADGEASDAASTEEVRLSSELVWQPAAHRVLRAGEEIVLTECEYALFVRLCEGRGTVLTPATLYEDVWHEPFLSSASNTVIVHIANLRRKLEKDPSSPAVIRTVWGKGYRID